MLIKPDFFDSFRCIASACRHTCCAGWEIEVDADTADYYASLSGEDGEFVRAWLDFGENGMLLCREGERCRFLRDDNLCALILRLGEDALCDICREHPRFYAGDGGVTLAGQGLVCEEAARLWLEHMPQLVIEADGEEPEEWAAAELAALTEALRAPETIVPAAISAADYTALRSLFVSLEAMDPDYPARYAKEPPQLDDPRLANLAAYFLYRYWFELGGETAAMFAAVSCVMIAALGGDLCDAARMYSGEVEYDTDNVARVCEFLETHDLACLRR